MFLSFAHRSKFALARKVVSVIMTFAFLTSLSTPAGAQLASLLPTPGSAVSISPVFVPPTLKGLNIHPENPFLFDFIVGRGDNKIEGAALKVESEKLVKFFLTAMTIPDKEAWVNLSPYEANRIIPDALGKTEMGKVMLEQDYLLKQLASSLTNPDTDLGKKFWTDVRAKAKEKFGTTDIPMSTFNKVWIVPSKAEVAEKDGKVFITQNSLKVMLEEDYVAMQKTNVGSGLKPDQDRTGLKPVPTNEINNVSSQVFRSTILPTIEKEINEGKNFAAVRQIYDAAILAVWYKSALKESLLGKIYADKSKVKGIETDAVGFKEEVYKKYVEAFKKGAYNMIKEDFDMSKDESVPTRYFSGGVVLPSVVVRSPKALSRSGADVAGSALVTVYTGENGKDGRAVADKAAAQSAGSAVKATDEEIRELKNSLPGILGQLTFLLDVDRNGASYDINRYIDDAHYLGSRDWVMSRFYFNLTFWARYNLKSALNVASDRDRDLESAIKKYEGGSFRSQNQKIDEAVSLYREFKHNSNIFHAQASAELFLDKLMSFSKQEKQQEYTRIVALIKKESESPREDLQSALQVLVARDFLELAQRNLKRFEDKLISDAPSASPGQLRLLQNNVADAQSLIFKIEQELRGYERLGLLPEGSSSSAVTDNFRKLAYNLSVILDTVDDEIMEYDAIRLVEVLDQMLSPEFRGLTLFVLNSLADYEKTSVETKEDLSKVINLIEQLRNLGEDAQEGARRFDEIAEEIMGNREIMSALVDTRWLDNPANLFSAAQMVEEKLLSLKIAAYNLDDAIKARDSASSLPAGQIHSRVESAFALLLTQRILEDVLLYGMSNSLIERNEDIRDLLSDIATLTDRQKVLTESERDRIWNQALGLFNEYLRVIGKALSAYLDGVQKESLLNRLTDAPSSGAASSAVTQLEKILADLRENNPTDAQMYAAIQRVSDQTKSILSDLAASFQTKIDPATNDVITKDPRVAYKMAVAQLNLGEGYELFFSLAENAKKLKDSGKSDAQVVAIVFNKKAIAQAQAIVAFEKYLNDPMLGLLQPQREKIIGVLKQGLMDGETNQAILKKLTGMLSEIADSLPAAASSTLMAQAIDNLERVISRAADNPIGVQRVSMAFAEIRDPQTFPAQEELLTALNTIDEQQDKDFLIEDYRNRKSGDDAKAVYALFYKHRATILKSLLQYRATLSTSQADDAATIAEMDAIIAAGQAALENGYDGSPSAGATQAQALENEGKSASSQVGGINFDPTLMNLQVKRDKNGVPLPVFQQDLPNINIEGLYPVIINIVPATMANFPLLSKAEEEKQRIPSVKDDLSPIDRQKLVGLAG